MEILLYPIIVFLETALGTTSGVGGGAIIKPVFDLIGIDNVTVIGIYSTIAVFSCACHPSANTAEVGWYKYTIKSS